MARSLVKTGTVHRVPFEVYTATRAPVTGLTAPANLTLLLSKDDASSAIAVTVVEIDAGRYVAKFTSDTDAVWRVVIRPVSAAHFPAFWHETLESTADGTTTLAQAADALLDRQLGGSAGTRTLRHLGRRLLAVLFGRSSGMVAGQATASAKWYGEDDATVVVDGALDVNGNRTVKPTVNDA